MTYVGFDKTESESTIELAINNVLNPKRILTQTIKKDFRWNDVTKVQL